MRSELFREDLFAARRSELLGSIRLRAPRPGWFFCAFGLLIVACILALLIGGHYTRHERADGALVPSDGLLTLSPVSPGLVERLLVMEGSIVRAGQPLVEIS
jgi:membrane fusion protein